MHIAAGTQGGGDGRRGNGKQRAHDEAYQHHQEMGMGDEHGRPPPFPSPVGAGHHGRRARAQAASERIQRDGDGKGVAEGCERLRAEPP